MVDYCWELKFIPRRYAEHRYTLENVHGIKTGYRVPKLIHQAMLTGRLILFPNKGLARTFLQYLHPNSFYRDRSKMPYPYPFSKFLQYDCVPYVPVLCTTVKGDLNLKRWDPWEYFEHYFDGIVVNDVKNKYTLEYSLPPEELGSFFVEWGVDDIKQEPTVTAITFTGKIKIFWQRTLFVTSHTCTGGSGGLPLGEYGLRPVEGLQNVKIRFDGPSPPSVNLYTAVVSASFAEFMIYNHYGELGDA